MVSCALAGLGLVTTLLLVEGPVVEFAAWGFVERAIMVYIIGSGWNGYYS